MFSIGKQFCRTDCERLFKNLICNKYLTEDTILSHPRGIIVAQSYVRLGEMAPKILSNEQRFHFLVKRKSGYRALDISQATNSSDVNSGGGEPSHPWNTNRYKRFRKNETNSKYFKKSKPASDFGFQTNSFMSVPSRKPKKPQL